MQFLTAVILYLTKFIYMLLHENIFHEQIIPTSFSEKKSATYGSFDMNFSKLYVKKMQISNLSKKCMLNFWK